MVKLGHIEVKFSILNEFNFIYLSFIKKIIQKFLNFLFSHISQVYEYAIFISFSSLGLIKLIEKYLERKYISTYL